MFGPKQRFSMIDVHTLTEPLPKIPRPNSLTSSARDLSPLMKPDLPGTLDAQIQSIKITEVEDRQLFPGSDLKTIHRLGHSISITALPSELVDRILDFTLDKVLPDPRVSSPVCPDSRAWPTRVLMATNHFFRDHVLQWHHNHGLTICLSSWSGQKKCSLLENAPFALLRCFKNLRLDLSQLKWDDLITNHATYNHLSLIWNSEHNLTSLRYRASLSYIELPRMKAMREVESLLYDASQRLGVEATWEPDFTGPVNAINDTAVHQAIRRRRTDIVQCLLLNSQEGLDKGNDLDFTPLLTATSNGEQEIVELLLRTNRIDVNKNNGYVTAIMISVLNEADAISELIWRTGKVDLTIKSAFGETVIDIARRLGNGHFINMIGMRNVESTQDQGNSIY